MWIQCDLMLYVIVQIKHMVLFSTAISVVAKLKETMEEIENSMMSFKEQQRKMWVNTMSCLGWKLHTQAYIKYGGACNLLSLTGISPTWLYDAVRCWNSLFSLFVCSHALWVRFVFDSSFCPRPQIWRPAAWGEDTVPGGHSPGEEVWFVVPAACPSDCRHKCEEGGDCFCNKCTTATGSCSIWGECLRHVSIDTLCG